MKTFALIAALLAGLFAVTPDADARHRRARVRLVIVERPAVVLVESSSFLAVRSFAVREVIELDRYGRRVLVTVDAFGVRRLRFID